MNPETLAACPLEGCDGRQLVDYSLLTQADADAMRAESQYRAARWIIGHMEAAHPDVTVTVTAVAP